MENNTENNVTSIIEENNTENNMNNTENVGRGCLWLQS